MTLLKHHEERRVFQKFGQPISARRCGWLVAPNTRILSSLLRYSVRSQLRRLIQESIPVECTTSIARFRCNLARCEVFDGVLSA